jgi:muramoyltetrapeptide carboxypeptidase
VTTIQPQALRPGDKIGIVAPASNVKRDLLEAGCARLRQLGYEPVYSQNILERDLYFAGTLERRVQEIEQMLEQDDICALICARGGYGSNYLLEQLKFEKFTQHPKILVGYSDNTSLLTAIHDRTGLITFHGPMVTKDFASADGVELTSWNNAVQGAATWNIPTTGVEVLQPGRARGRVYGGCLSILVASLGTQFEIKTGNTTLKNEDTLLFLEDIAAKPYQVDRMLTQLRMAGKLRGVRGIIFGEMLDCLQPGGQDYTLQQAIVRALQGPRGPDADVPIVYGLKSGHVSSSNVTLPLGVEAELTASDAGVELKIVEQATKNRVIG